MMVKRPRIVVIGAGVSGLEAVRQLSRYQVEIVLLEARDRCGGRIHTHYPEGGWPIELGAEFLHGHPLLLEKALRRADLQCHQVPDRHAIYSKGKLHRVFRFWKKLTRVSSQIDPAQPDISFADYLKGIKLNPKTKTLGRHFAQGFHAADLDRISVLSVLKSELVAEGVDGTCHFRIHDGYQKLIDNVQSGMTARLHLNTVVKRIQWRPGNVKIFAAKTESEGTIAAQAVLITVPLGVLQASLSLRGSIEFHPRLSVDSKPFGRMAMGKVTKVVMVFRERFWPQENFGFIHSPHLHFQTWWSDERGPVITAWAGGPKSKFFHSRAQVEEEAIKTVSKIFSMPRRKIEPLVEKIYFHDWSRDPFSRGAYAYLPVGGAGLPRQMAEPISGTLFFAGEATALRGEQGTVHGALASGLRAAGQLIQALKLKPGRV